MVEENIIVIAAKTRCDRMRYRRYSPALLFCALLAIVERGAAQPIVSGALLASLKTGSLAGLTFPVAFSYDASGASSQGQVYLPLTAFNFSLSGTAFTRAGI